MGARLEKISLISIITGIAIFFICISGQAYFQDTAYGVRPAGMSEAFTAVADDANTILFNPAGLANINQIELMGMYADLYSNFNARLYSGEYDRSGYNFLAAVVPVKILKGSLGISWRQFYSTFYKENVFTFGYGLRVWPAYKLDIGFNLKGLQWLVEANDFTTNTTLFPYDNRSKLGLTADIGLAAEILPQLKVGLAWDNIIPTDMGLTTKEIIAAIYRLGASYKINFNHPFIDSLQLAAELTSRDNIRVPKFGLEAWMIREVLAIRTGISTDHVTAGLSYRQGMPQRALSLQVDYAFSYSFQIPDNWGSHRVGLTFGWMLESQTKAKPKPELIVKQPMPQPTKSLSPPTITREQAIKELLNDPNYMQFKKFMEYQAFIAAEAEKKSRPKKKKSKQSKSFKMTSKANEKQIQAKIIKHKEDRIIVGVETKCLTDLWSIQHVLNIVNQLEQELEKKTNIPLQLRRFNSQEALNKAFVEGQVDIIIRDVKTDQQTLPPKMAKDLLTIEKQGKHGAPYALIIRGDDKVTNIKELEGKRLGYVVPSDLIHLQQEFFKKLKLSDLRNYFNKMTQYESTRACLLALQMKEVDVIIGLEHLLSIYQKDKQMMLKGAKPIAISSIVEPFAPMSIRTTLSENKIKKIMTLLKVSLTMHHDPTSHALLESLGFDRLAPVSK